MSNEQRRERFEQAVIDRMKEGGFLEVEIRVECLVRSGDGYYDGSVDAYWHFWNAALDSVVVELPPRIDADDVAEHFAIDEEGHDMAVGIAQMVNGAISACGSFIKAAGMQVKPCAKS